MSKLPIVKPDELIRALEKLGFSRLRKSRSGHQRFGHPDGRKTTVPVHKGKTIGRGLLRKILNDIGISADDLRELT
jgi:predicted RNA binding protein YcfA (HicA-like mRNA interferase family)